jgi:tetratricopeptide (TPR) repeat protein
VNARLLLAAFALTGPHAAAQQLKVEAAMSELEAIARRDSNDAVAQYNLALAYWSKRRWTDAERRFHAALAIDQGFAPAHLALAYLPRASGKFWTEHVIVIPGGYRIYYYTAPDSVVGTFDRLYRRAVMLDPLVDIRIAVATEWRGGHITDFDQALFDYNDGKWEQAVRRFGELVADSGAFRGERSGLFERVLWYRALALERLGRRAEAIDDLQRLLDRSLRREASDTLFRWPLRTNEYRYVLAYLKQRAGDHDAAVALYEEALTQDLGLYPAHTRIADIYEGARMWEPAVAAREQAVNAFPEDPGLSLNLGLTLAKAGRLRQAEAALAHAWEANHRDSRSAYYLGIVRQQLDDKEGARAAFSHFLASAPSRYERQRQDARQRLAALQ